MLEKLNSSNHPFCQEQNMNKNPAFSSNIPNKTSTHYVSVGQICNAIFHYSLQ